MSTFASIASTLKTSKSIKIEPFNMLKDDPGLWIGSFEKALENHGPVEDIAFATLFHLLDDSGQTWHFQYRRKNKIIIWSELKDDFVEFMQKRFVKKLGDLNSLLPISQLKPTSKNEWTRTNRFFLRWLKRNLFWQQWLVFRKKFDWNWLSTKTSNCRFFQVFAILLTKPTKQLPLQKKMLNKQMFDFQSIKIKCVVQSWDSVLGHFSAVFYH